MAEEETVKKVPSGNVRKYADNILPMVVKLFLSLASNQNC